jgi:hypothetical protein
MMLCEVADLGEFQEQELEAPDFVEILLFSCVMYGKRVQLK